MTLTSAEPVPDSRWSLFLEHQGPTLLCAIAGFLSAFAIPLVGQLPTSELVFFPLAAWAIIRLGVRRGWPVRMQQLGWFKLLVILIGLMALGYIISDLYRATSWGNLARGWARVAFLGIDLIAITYLIDGRWSRLWVFVLSLLIGESVNAAITGPLHGEWWKFGVGYLVTALGLYFAGGRSLLIQLVVAAAFGLLNLAMGSRGLGGTCLLISALFGLAYARGIWRPVGIMAALLSLVVLAYAASEVVDENRDHSGSNIERQSMIEAAAEAFVSSPLVGQGSWFTATERISRVEERRALHDPTFRGYTEEEARQLAIHSQILVTLAEGGILGGAFFLGLGALLLKTLRSLTLMAVPHRMFALFLVVHGIWNLLMSPFSGVARIYVGLTVALCLLVILQRQGELAEDFRE